MTGIAPKHAPKARRTPFLLLVAGLIGASLCLLLALNTASAANEVSRHNLAEKDAAVSDSLVQLNNQVAASAAPQNLAAAAAGLGMVPAANPAFLVVGADGSVHVMGSPAPASAPAIYLPPPTQATTPKAKPSTSSATSTSAKPSGSTSKAKTKSKTKKTTKKPARKTTSPTPSPTPTPSITPTPDSTLPGGTR
ncbi:hypothetical protein [Jatrophihabitans sp.]|uniref:hypothetical protein n=1 Tax=Jatrophihabitans sp. TaxID=1932789 RepID=UPI0030C68B1C|nr:ftsL2 [Jatrophihabitans sp.]